MQLLKPYHLISSTMNQLILLLSFGLCSPVLCFSIALGISVNLLTWLMLIGRFISHRLLLLPLLKQQQQQQSPNEESMLEPWDELLSLLSRQVEVERVQSSLLVCKWPILCTSCLFVTLLSWDMVGDQVGWEEGLWVPVVGLAMLLLLWLWDRFLKKYFLEILVLRHRTASTSLELITSSSSLHPGGPSSS
jgi:hypothetical protein